MPSHPRRPLWRLSVAALTLPLAVLTACGGGAAPTTTPSAAASAPGVDQAARALLPKQVTDAGKLVNAINVPNPPMEFRDPASNDLTGLDVELTEQIAAKLGLEASFTEVDFAQLLPSLNTGRADIVLSALSDTPERQASADWVDYFTSGDRFYTSTANAGRLSGYAALCGETIAVATGTSFVQDVPTLSAQVCAGKSPMQVLAIGAQGTEGIQTQISTGRAAAGVTGAETYGLLTTTTPGQWTAVGDIFASGPYGIAVKKGNDGVRGAVTAALKGMISDGSYAALLAKYGQQSSAVTAVTINQKPVQP